LSKVACRPTYVMDNLWFQKITITQIQSTAPYCVTN